MRIIDGCFYHLEIDRQDRLVLVVGAISIVDADVCGFDVLRFCSFGSGYSRNSHKIGEIIRRMIEDGIKRDKRGNK